MTTSQTAEELALADVRAGRLHIVCSKRKRKLKRRGVRCWWDRALGSWVWAPSNRVYTVKGAIDTITAVLALMIDEGYASSDVAPLIDCVRILENA